MEGTKAYNSALLYQTHELLLRLDDHSLTRPRALLLGGTIGQHVRHIVEYYHQLLTRCDTGVINYDERPRDHRIEASTTHAREIIDQCIGRIQALDGDHQLDMHSELPGKGGTVVQRTSILRELTYVADHCVHHLAMVRIVVEQELPGVELPEELGVAAATRNFRAR